MKKNTILTRLVMEYPLYDVFQDTERIEGNIRDIPRLKIGHIRADYSGHWRNSVWHCHNELATDEIQREIDEVYAALAAKNALADLNAFAKSRPEAKSWGRLIY